MSFLVVNARVLWRGVMRGGHPTGTPVAAVVKKIGVKQIQIELREKAAYSQFNAWHASTPPG